MQGSARLVRMAHDCNIDEQELERLAGQRRSMVGELLLRSSVLSPPPQPPPLERSSLFGKYMQEPEWLARPQEYC